jgi:hypothetical protein
MDEQKYSNTKKYEWKKIVATRHFSIGMRQ